MNYWHEQPLTDWQKEQRIGDKFLPWQQYVRLLTKARFDFPESHDSTAAGESTAALSSWRGIVLCGGGSLLPGVWVTVNLLRQFGCKLPVELWHIGPEELPPVYRKLLTPMDVRSVDAREVWHKCVGAAPLSGWQAKVLAVVKSSFREVLYIDADNHPTKDPAFLFDDPLYTSTGALFWPDRIKHGPDSKLWELFDVPYRDEEMHETGQFVIDRTRHWHALQVAMHCNQWSRFWYQHSHGDTALLRFAMHKLGDKFSMLPHRLLEVPVARQVEDLKTLETTPYMRQEGDIRAMFLQRAPDGSVLFQHRTAGGGAQERFGLGQYHHLQHFQHDQACRDLLEELRGHLPFYEALTGKYPERVSAHRRNGYAALFNAAEERGLRRIVEAGTLRQKDNWGGDGGFTWWAGAYAAKFGGVVDTVDISPDALAVAKEVCAEWGDKIRYHAGDSVEYLAANTEPIDILFLDSVDYDAASCFAAQDHNWREFSAALPHLHEKSVVAFDDATLAGGGKGGITIPRMEQTGWKVIHRDYVTVLARATA